MFALKVYTGFCMGLWCTIDTTPGFPSWESCNQERVAVMESMILQEKFDEDDETLVVAKCVPYTMEPPK